MNRGRCTNRPDDVSVSGRRWSQGIMAGLLLAGSGVFFWFFSVQPIFERRAVLVQAVAVDAVVEKAGQDALRSYIVRYDESPTRMYEPQIRLRYAVNGHEYLADAYSCGQLAMRKDDASLIASSYAPGQQVRAWYPAGSPSQAFLVKAYDPTPHIGLMMLGPAIFICGGIMLTALVPLGTLDDPDPRVQFAVGLVGTAVSGGVLAHYLTQSEYGPPPLMWLLVAFFLGIPVFALLWGAKEVLARR